MRQAITTDIAVVGAGPAGLAAATAARRSGATVLLIDAFAMAGGQYFMQPVSGVNTRAQVRAGNAAIRAAAAVGVKMLTGTEIFAAYPGFQLFGSGAQGAVAVNASAVIAATGAHDRVMAFPGWTLPGVMTAGAGQRLTKVNGVLPGRRVVIAGSGPFLWAVAQSLLDKGADIAALVEARHPSPSLVAHLAVFPERWLETVGLVAPVLREVKRVVFGRIVAEATGDGRLEQVAIADSDGTRAETLTGIDALLISYGFQPNLEITALLDCVHDFDDALGGWYAVVDGDTGRTSIPGLYASGEVTGIAGARPALLSGELAGLSAAAALGFATDSSDAKLATLRQRLARARRFGHGLGRLFVPLPELDRLARPDTILCRCEEITRAEVQAACGEGADNIYGMKIWTRAGMGRCQGRLCRMSLTACIARATGRSPRLVGFNHPRVPSRPVPVEQVLAAMQEVGAAVPGPAAKLR